MKYLSMALAGLAAAGLFLIAPVFLPTASKPTTITSTGPTVERLQKLSHLATMRVLVADVLVGEAEGCRGSWLIKGDGLLGVDLGRAAIVEKDDRTCHATIRLPQPEALQSRVDHDKTRTWEVRKTGWIPWRGDQDQLRDQVMREAQALVAHAAVADENIRQAKAGAENVIRAFYKEVGWDIRVVWEAAVTGRP